MSVKTLTATEARTKFLNLIKASDQSLDRFVITVQGVPKAVLLSYEDFMELEEELEILAQNPNFFEDRKRAHQEYKKGETVILEELSKEFT
ncbi:MAG: type II toxin-antitoxin system Phd/YefM family antitoxin [FCB group bacterium]|nr:type II toxin-antitoxin system Phd/YefM family antitoxin [FCB group bacterium]